MNKPTHIEVPLSLVGTPPDLIATYLALRAVATVFCGRRWEIDEIADTAGIDGKIVRLCLLQLRIMGFLRLRTSMMAREMLDDFDDVGIQLIDQQMSFVELAIHDPCFEDFAASIITDRAEIIRWVSEDNPSEDLQRQRKTVIHYVIQASYELLKKLGREAFFPSSGLSSLETGVAQAADN